MARGSQPDPDEGQEVHLGGHLRRWRIVDPLRFFQRLRDERNAQSRLDDIIDGETRNAIASFALIEAVRSTNRSFEEDEYFAEIEGAEALEKVMVGRDKLTRQIRDRAADVVKEFGVELVDVQIRRINYVDEVQVKVFERMISERRRIAERSRSEGMGRAAEIRGQRERDLKRIRSEAYRKAQEVTGKGDAEATRSTRMRSGATRSSSSFFAPSRRIRRRWTTPRRFPRHGLGVLPLSPQLEEAVARRTGGPLARDRCRPITRLRFPSRSRPRWPLTRSATRPSSA